jgi:hypothetical protein
MKSAFQNQPQSTQSSRNLNSFCDLSELGG